MIFFKEMFLEHKNQHIRLISEESCDTKDWSDDADNPALLSYKKIQKMIL